MNNLKKFFYLLLLILSSGFLLVGCQDEENDELSGNVNFEITDAPTDDADVEAVFVTVTEVKVDGTAIADFEGRQTIDLLALQNGKTQLLGSTELDAGAYSEVSLVLDYEKDENGNSPGCYVMTQDQTKHDLKNTSETEKEYIISTADFEVESNATTNIVLDFDVRKAVRYDSGNQDNNRYEFANDSEVEASIRLVNKSESGTIEGNCSDLLGFGGDRIVVYAYQKGSFNKDTETEGQGEGNIQFRNAVTSSAVDANNNFTLSFLQEGEYELHFAAYEDSNNDNRLEYKGMLNVEVTGVLDLLGIQLDANANITTNVTVTGISQ